VNDVGDQDPDAERHPDVAAHLDDQPHGDEYQHAVREIDDEIRPRWIHTPTFVPGVSIITRFPGQPFRLSPGRSTSTELPPWRLSDPVAREQADAAGPIGAFRQFLALRRDVLVLSVAMFAFSLGFQPDPVSGSTYSRRYTSRTDLSNPTTTGPKKMPMNPTRYTPPRTPISRTPGLNVVCV